MEGCKLPTAYDQSEFGRAISVYAPDNIKTLDFGVPFMQQYSISAPYARTIFEK